MNWIVFAQSLAFFAIGMTLFCAIMSFGWWLQERFGGLWGFCAAITLVIVCIAAFLGWSAAP